MLKRYILLISSLTVLAGCQSLPGGGHASADTGAGVQSTPSVTATPRPAATTDSEPAPPADLWARIGDQLSWYRNQRRPEVAQARRRYLAQPSYFEVVSARADMYLFYIVEEVERRGLPLELALLPLVESTLNPRAVSPSYAAGLWQIMPATGNHLGVNRDWWYDGRHSVRESTQVALDYLEALNAEFDGDWLLTLAAYNGGNGRVSRAIADNRRRGRPTDYWSLNLPRETRAYLPRLLAISQIVAEPDHFGLALPAVANEPAFEVAQTGGQIELARAAELAGVELATLRALNPGQLRWATAPGNGNEILLPPDTVAQFEARVAELPDEERVQWQYYRIQPGDSLIRIARQHNTDVALLRQANSIKGNLIRAGDTLMIPSGGNWSNSLALNGGGTATVRRGYKVRSGDSLYRIASRFKVSVDDIVGWNSLDPKAYLRPGQQLTLYAPGS